MAFRQSPNFVASGAMGILTGLAIAGGLVFALSLSASAEERRIDHAASLEAAPAPVLFVPRLGASEGAVAVHARQDLRTYGNSTARALVLERALSTFQIAGGSAAGENVASETPARTFGGPQS